MHVFKLFHSLTILSIVFLIAACRKPLSDHSPKFKGPEVTMANGVARSYVQVSPEGVPEVIGIEMSPESLNNLSPHHSVFVLPLDTLAKRLTPFKHIAINWNPHGHAPNHIYGAPHFDFHFYTISDSDRLAIPAYDTDPTGFNKLPPDGFMPGNYKSAGSDSQMGMHWVDSAAVELTGAKFTNTFVYGSFANEVNFYEPMIAFDVFKEGRPFTAKYAQPAKFLKNKTYYPTVYNFGKDQCTGNYYVTLSKFVLR